MKQVVSGNLPDAPVMQSAFESKTGGASKNERDAMVAKLFAAKKQMQSGKMSASASYANGFRK